MTRPRARRVFTVLVIFCVLATAGAVVVARMATSTDTALEQAALPRLPTPLPSVSSPSPSAAATASPPAEAPGARSARLGSALRALVDEQRFGEIHDRATGGRVTRMPNVDVAVIELDASGRPVAAAEVLLSAQYPHGVAVPVDGNLRSTGVRWRQWSDSRWARGATGGTDIVAAPSAAKHDYLAPYPASVFKLMVAFGVLRLVDAGKVTLDGPYRYAPSTRGCPDGGAPRTRTVRAWLDAMLTVSDNRSTCAMVALLHSHGGVTALNATFRRLGLDTLRLAGTTRDGGTWTSSITMTALDTARLLLLASGGPGVLWRAPDGSPVTADVLSATSRAAFTRILGEQALNQVLSTSNHCGRAYPAQGIPQRIAARWIDPDGVVRAHGRDFGRDVRPCNAAAEVTFAHKTGLVTNACADAGIVTSLPGAPGRRYIIATFSNLGSRFGDATARGGQVACSERFARIGKGVDTLLTAPR